MVGKFHLCLQTDEITLTCTPYFLGNSESISLISEKSTTSIGLTFITLNFTEDLNLTLC